MMLNMGTEESLDARFASVRLDKAYKANGSRRPGLMKCSDSRNNFFHDRKSCMSVGDGLMLMKEK
jgi:hypothetical protein